MAGRRGSGSLPGDEERIDPESASLGGPSPDQLCAYIEEMLVELAKLAASAGRHGLATTLRIASIEAGEQKRA